MKKSKKFKFEIVWLECWPCDEDHSDINFKVHWVNLETGEEGVKSQGDTFIPNDMIPILGDTWFDDVFFVD